jgi:CDP-glucose 4,6-dehydratase
MNSNFWKGKNVLVTGHTGFKGSWLVLMMKELGAKVSGYSVNIPTNPSMFELCNVSSFLEYDFRADICDFNKLQDALAMTKPDIVFHLAAQPLVRYSYTYPIETYQTNVMGTLSVLSAFEKSSTAKVLINITTDKCYQNNEWHWGYRENDRLGGHDPYSSSKACVEIMSESFRKSFLHNSKKVMATARAGNVIGGGDFAQDRIVPDFFRAFAKNEKIKIRNPHAIRPWQHVMEPLAGYIMLAERCFVDQSYGQAWNFGPNDEGCKNVGDLINHLVSITPNHRGVEVEILQSNPHEATFLKLDCSKAKNILGWHPRFNFENNLEITKNWYIALDQNKLQVTLEQIRHFIGRDL